MRNLVREWGQANPLEMESKEDGSFEVLMPSEESVERLLAYNYHEVEGIDQVLQVLFSLVDIFDLLEEHLGEAEDLEAAFPRGVRARAVASERPRGGYSANHIPAQGVSLSSKIPRGVPRSHRVGRS